MSFRLQNTFHIMLSVAAIALGLHLALTDHLPRALFALYILRNGLELITLRIERRPFVKLAVAVSWIVLLSGLLERFGYLDLTDWPIPYLGMVSLSAGLEIYALARLIPRFFQLVFRLHDTLE